MTDPPPAARAVAPSPSTGSDSPGGPLEGVTVLDLASVGPAARCTRLLADYGATVVKVGAVPGTGAQPITPPFYAYSGSRYLIRTAIDLKVEEGRQAFLALVRTADVVVESFRPGVVDRLGIGFEDLCAVNPGIILCSTTGYGQNGPRSAWAGHDINYLAQGGYLATTEPAADGGPPVSGATIADAAGGGMHAALAVMAALVGRAAGGPGVHLDVSIADGVLWLTSLAVDEYLGHRGRRRPRPEHHHRSLRLLRHVPSRRRRLAGRGGYRAQVLRQPVPAPRVRAVGGTSARRRRPGQDPFRLQGGLRGQGP